MINLNETQMHGLSFPDMNVRKMEFSPENKKLAIFVDGAYLDTDNIGILGPGTLYFYDWNSIVIRRYKYSLNQWSLVSLKDPEQLNDLCEVFFNSSDVILCGFGKTLGQWLEWKINNTKMHAEFEKINVRPYK